MRHPGVVLGSDFMRPRGLSQYRVAVDIGVPPRRINQIVHGRRAISADTALRLARYFGTDPEYWMLLQARWDLARAADRLPAGWERAVRVFDPALPRPSRGRPRKEVPPAASPTLTPDPGSGARSSKDYLFVDDF